MTTSNPRFSLGQVVATPGAIAEMRKAGQMPQEFLSRHLACDWGDVSQEDAELNEEALTDGSRLMSVYSLKTKTTIWIITEAADDEGHRICSTLLLPSEY